MFAQEKAIHGQKKERLKALFLIDY